MTNMNGSVFALIARKLRRGMSSRLLAAGCLVLGTLCSQTSFSGQKIFIYASSDGGAISGWNKLSFVNGHQPGILDNLVDSEAKPTSVRFFLTVPAVANYANSTGAFTGEASDFEAGRSGFGHTVACSTDPTLSDASLGPEYRGYFEESIRGRFEGLNPAKRYEFSFAAQRNMSSDENASTRYVVWGLNRGEVVLNAAKNTTKVARVANIVPSAAGMVEFTVAATPENVTFQHFGFVNAIRIEEMDDAVPTEDIFLSMTRNPAGVDGLAYYWNHLPSTSSGNNCWLMKNASGVATSVSIGNSGTSEYNGDGGVTTPYTGDAAEFNDLFGTGKREFLFCSGSLTFYLRGLNPDALYDFTMLPSRPAGWSQDKNCNTECRVTGRNSDGGVVDAQQNFTKVVKALGIRPNGDGTVAITVSKAEGNTSGYCFINGIKIHRQALCEAGDARIEVTASVGGSVTATVAGSASETMRYLGTGESMVVTAVPLAGYKFLGWATSGTGERKSSLESDNPLTIPGGKAARWTATFAKDTAFSPKQVYIDVFGPTIDPNKTWNSFSDAWFGREQAQGRFFAADGSETSLGVQTIRAWGVRDNGTRGYNMDNKTPFTGELVDFEPARADTYNLWMQIGWAKGDVSNRALVVHNMCGLKPGLPYKFRFAASRQGAGDNRETLFRCIGANTLECVVNVAGNLDKVAVCDGVVADASGMIRLETMPGPNNNNGNRFAHLVALSIEGAMDVSTAKNILWYGNSFSGMGDLPLRVANLAELAGFERPNITFSYASGMDMAYHLGQAQTNPEKSLAVPAIKYGFSQWDEVVLQGRNREMTTMGDRQGVQPKDGYLANSVALFNLVRTGGYGANARAVIYEPWAFARGYTAGDFAGYGQSGCFNSPVEMQRQIKDTGKALRGMINAAYVGGTAVMATVGESYAMTDFSTDFYDADLFHQGGKYGPELISIVLFNTIYKTKISGLITYQRALDAGVTALTESEWNRMMRLADARDGLALIFR